MTPTDTTCRVIQQARKVQQTVEDLAGSMRRLRAYLSQCESCPAQDCPMILELSASISTAIQELSDEWRL